MLSKSSFLGVEAEKEIQWKKQESELYIDYQKHLNEDMPISPTSAAPCIIEDAFSKAFLEIASFKSLFLSTSDKIYEQQIFRPIAH